jgi:hypothetical protein
LGFSGKIWTVDIATNTGWACGLPGEVPRIGSLRFGPKSCGHEHRFAEAFDWASEFVFRHKPDVYAYEEPQPAFHQHGHTNLETQILLSGLIGAIGAAVSKAQVARLYRVRVSDIRHHFIQKNPKRAIAKPMVIERCRQLGWEPRNDNEADALALWSYMRSFFDPTFALVTTPLFGQVPA